jgi:sulfur-carrier protein adenylyltransferase/sulfurtransferase
MALSSAELLRYSRHLQLGEVGRAGQERLQASRVVVIGAGGLGAPASLYLAAAGVGTLGLVDFDRVELSNLQRQILFDTQDVAQPKVAAAQRRLQTLNPGITVVAHEVELCAANVLDVLGAYDVVIDGTDRLGTRYLVNDACVLLRKPLVSAAIHRFEGQAMTYVPGRGPCYRCLFPEISADQVPNCAEAGVLGVLPGVLGALQATEALKVLLDIGEPLLGRLLTFDALELRFREFAVARRIDCAVCGDRPSITVPQDAALPSAAQLAGVRRLTPAELQALLVSCDRARRPIVVIDVREPDEFAAGHLLHTVSVPLAEFAGRVPDLDRGATVVLVCKSGRRSAQACEIAVGRGLGDVAHLEGGLLAWAATIDPSLTIA